MNEWLDDLCGAGNADGGCVVVTVAGVRGSAPRDTGAKMIVTAKETIGTIGGGQLEYQCTRIGVEQLRPCGARADARLQRRFPLGTNCGQCCGGVVDIMFERIAAAPAAWLAAVRRLYAERRPLVIVTPLDQSSGKYVVTDSDCMPFDTSDACPGGIAAAARQIIAAKGGAYAKDGFLMEPVLQSDFHVAVFGAGHVGTATVDILSRLDCNIRWIDGRRNIFPPGLPGNVTAIESGNPAREVSAMPTGTSYLVMTHSHPADYEICDQDLQRDDFAYCGLIGSLSKRRRFERDLRKQGMPESRFARLTCPIGVAGIDSKKPADIAVAVAAELLRVRDAAAAAIQDNDSVPKNVNQNVHVI